MWQKCDPTKSESFVPAIAWELLAEFEWTAGHEPTQTLSLLRSIASLLLTLHIFTLFSIDVTLCLCA
jgi:hypothetical protein